MLSIESSERSRKNNTLQDLINSIEGYSLIEFEGFTIKENKVTAFLDKYRYSENLEALYKKDSNNYIQQLIKEYEELYVGFNEYTKKRNLAQIYNIPWFLVIYDVLENVLIIHVDTENNIWENPTVFNSYAHCGEWIYENLKDMKVKSPFEEDGLPDFDKKLRKHGTPWPGNLDSVLFINEEPISIIEFQTTNKTSVNNHDNNKFFYPIQSSPRKGDQQRWRVLDLLSDQLKLPILVGVWSPNENYYCLKKIEEINYSDHETPIRWGEKQLVDGSSIQLGIEKALERNK